MNTERWERTKQILDDALHLPTGQREAFLDCACGNDSEMRVEVESLVASHKEADSQFLAVPAAEVLQFPIVDHAVGPPPETFGHYRLAGEIGRGGMGVVYRAEDILLGRSVAIKFLPPEIATDSSAFERLQLEARAASALDHPNICSIYELGEQQGCPFIAMQLLDGQTLRDWIETPKAESSSRLAECIALAIQIARGLQAAHEKGIIHRDIKPANIFVTSRGDAKILDFGLAKVLEEQSPARPSPEVAGATSTSTGPNPAFSGVHLTRTGIALGTAAYMSPEQIRGEKVDSQTDIFSFGLLLYEMATGQRAFAESGAEKVREAILFTEPRPIRSINPQLPAELERIVRKGISKDRARRYSSFADVIGDLEKLKRQTDSRAEVAKWSVRAAGVLVLALVAVGLYYGWRSGQGVAEKEIVVVADFANATGDKAFDAALKPALSAALNQSRFLTVISDDQVTWTLQKMVRPADTPLTLEVAREVCKRANIRSFIAGSITSLGNQYIVGLKGLNCRSEDVLAEEQVSAASKESVLSALNSAARKLSAELAEKLASTPKLDLPLEDVTTSSLHALEAYSTGVRAEREKGPAEALHYYQRAVELDPDFASGYSAVGGTYIELGENTRAMEYLTKAFELREHASRRENLGITADYYNDVTGELDKAAQAYHNLIANYPRKWGPHIALGNVYSSQGLYAKAGDEYREAVHLGNDSNYENLANTALALQQVDEALEAIQEAKAHKSDGYLLHLQLYAVGFLKSDTQRMGEQQRWFAAHPDVEHDGAALASDTEVFAGHVMKSRELTRHAVEAAIRADSKEGAAIWEENAALREAALGNTAEARRFAAEGLKLSPGSQGVQAEAALALAMSGDTAQPVPLMQQLEKRYPLDTQVQTLWLAPIRAQVQLDRGNPAAALASLPEIGALEFGLIPFLNNLSCVYPAYIRGEAYLAAGRGVPAAAEFQKILDHSGVVWNCWTGALAHLGLARANALQAKISPGSDADAARARAIRAYNDFLTLWKDADPDVPILKQAKAEYARLQ